MLFILPTKSPPVMKYLFLAAASLLAVDAIAQSDTTTIPEIKIRELKSIMGRPEIEQGLDYGLPKPKGNPF